MSVGLAAVYVAAVVSTVAGLVWAVAANVWSRVSMRRWDAGVDL